MIRNAHRTLLARSFAVCLIALAASPVTAPFTVFDVTDFGDSQPANTPYHPGHEMAEAHVRIAPHLVVTSPDGAPALAVVRRDGPVLDGPRVDAPTTSRTHHLILRV